MWWIREDFKFALPLYFRLTEKVRITSLALLGILEVPRSPQKSSLTKNPAFGHNEKVKSLGRGKKIWEIVKFFIHVNQLSFQKRISQEIWFVVREVVTRNVTL